MKQESAEEGIAVSGGDQVSEGPLYSSEPSKQGPGLSKLHS